MIRTLCLVISAILPFLLISCAPGHRENMERIDSLRTAAEQLIKVQSLMGWENWVFGKPSNQDSLYKAHADSSPWRTLRLYGRPNVKKKIRSNASAFPISSAISLSSTSERALRF